MIIRQACLYMMMVSGIFLFAGCYILADRPQGEAQLDSTTLGTQSKSLTGLPRDVGSDGSIKPHPQPSYNMSQDSESQTGGTITLDAPIDMPNMGMDPIKGSTGGSGSNSTRSSGGASGRGSK